MRLQNRLFGQHCNGLVVQNRLAIQQSVMSVAGIRIERDIGDQSHREFLFCDSVANAADQIVFPQCLAA